MSVDNLVKNTFAIFNIVSAVKVEFLHKVAAGGHLVKYNESFDIVSAADGGSVTAAGYLLVMTAPPVSHNLTLHWGKNGKKSPALKHYENLDVRRIFGHFLHVIGKTSVTSDQVIILTNLMTLVIDQVEEKIATPMGKYEMYSSPSISEKLKKLRAANHPLLRDIETNLVDIAALKKENAERFEEIKKLRGDLDTAESAATELRDKNTHNGSEIDKLRKELAAAHETIAELRAVNNSRVATSSEETGAPERELPTGDYIETLHDEIPELAPAVTLDAPWKWKDIAGEIIIPVRVIGGGGTTNM